MALTQSQIDNINIRLGYNDDVMLTRKEVESLIASWENEQELAAELRMSEDHG